MVADALSELRKQIDALDQEILALINRRARIALEVAKAKTASGENDCFYRPEREVEVLRTIKAQNQGPLADEDVMRLFRELMSSCLALEKPMRVAFLGPEGTFTQQAAYKHFGHAVQVVSLPTIAEVFREVESAACQFGVVPVENSTEGVISHTLDQFISSPLSICGEIVLRIHHNLLAKEDGVKQIEEVFSHQQSLAQCREWLDRNLPHAKRTGVNSNAEAARMVAGIPHSAAIAGEVAAELYRLQVLEQNIEDEPDNTTRFLVIGQHSVGQTREDKTTVMVSTENRPGALYQVLEPFARFGISMTKIESRPSRRGAWDYLFFIDLEGHRDDPKVARALESLKETASMFKILGAYPRAVM